MNPLLLNKMIEEALREDIGYDDLTTSAVIPPDHHSLGKIMVKQDGVIAGLPVAQEVFKQIDRELIFHSFFQDGQRVSSGTVIATVEGLTRSILMGERVALNYMQRLSGIATTTREIVDKVKDSGVHITDTRKTTPGLRMLEKYAVKVGGGMNHRFTLNDAVLIKDNHIAAAGSIKTAIERVKNHIGHMVKIEVETETKEQVKEAVEAGADVILLDNMPAELIKEVVALIPDHITVEVSGGITPHNITQIAVTGVDVISIGWLTHSITALDISLDLKAQ